MGQDSTKNKASAAVAGWQAFAAEGKKSMDEEAELGAKCDQLYPPRPLPDGHQPVPVRFYGPGPHGRLHSQDPPVGTLHFARWRHELAAVSDPLDDGYYQEQNLPILNGQRVRPTYTTKGNRAPREVNYFRWERIPADALENVKTFPGFGATRVVHDEYLLNDYDFNAKDSANTKPKALATIHNRQDEDPRGIYPLGYKLLSQSSAANGHSAWQEGDCLGVDPRNPNALTKYIGWFPKRFRRDGAGLGADAQDAIWNEIFHGNLDAKPKEKFIPPKETWSRDPQKVTTLSGSQNSHATLRILSLTTLKGGLPPPEPDTLKAREAWLDARATERSRFLVNKIVATNAPSVDETKGLSPRRKDVTTDAKPVPELELAKGLKAVNIKETINSGDSEVTKQSDCQEIPPGPKSSGTNENGPSTETRVPIRDVDEERKAIEMILKEHARNPKPGMEGKRPIVVYQAFRSKLLGVPVTQIVGYER